MKCAAQQAPLGSTLQAPAEPAPATDTAGGIKRGRDDAEYSESISLPDSSESDSDDDEEDPDADSSEA